MSAPDPTAEVTAFHEHAEYTGVRADEREKWLDLRKTMLTASDVAAILGEDEHRSALDVYVDKITERRGPEVITLEDPRFWGTTFEQPMLRAVAKYFGWGYRAGGFLLRSRRHPYLGATLDAEIERGDGVWLDFEGKTTRIPRGWDQESGELPTRVLIQVQTQLLVTGAPMAIVFALLQGSRPCRIEVHPSQEFFEVIVDAAERFMAAIAALDPPAPEGKRGSHAALDRLYPREDGSVVTLPADALEWTREYQKASADEGRAKREKERYAQLLKSHIGAATFGLLPEPVGGKSCWRWQTQKRDGYVVEPGESRVLLALKDAPATATHPMLAPPANDTLTAALLASTEPEREREVAPIRFGGTKRRRSRR